MKMLEDKSNEEIVRSILCEIAKCKNEISCAKVDIEKATNRINFSILLLNTILDRKTLD